jgi:hypothetical protein
VTRIFLPSNHHRCSSLGNHKKLTVAIVTVVILCATVYALVRWRNGAATDERLTGNEVVSGRMDPLPALDAHGITGVREIAKLELLRLMTKRRPLTQSEKADIDRGCPGLTCLYQGLGLKRWPESAPGTRAYLSRDDAMNRRCPDGQQNFVFVKQAWWESGNPPKADPTTREVSLNSITRAKPGWYTFNYAVYFPRTATYAWINHREYGFPANLIWPQKAYLSLSPPPVDETRPAQIYCSTCR